MSNQYARSFCIVPPFTLSVDLLCVLYCIVVPKVTWCSALSVVELGRKDERSAKGCS